MAGSRSASQRKRKRDTTSQTLDILNNLHNPTDRVSLSSPVRPRRPLRRQTTRKTQSPEESRSAPSRIVPHTEPITPRRSRRLQTNPVSESTPSRKASRVQPNGNNLGSEFSSGSDDISDYESEEDTNVATKRNAMTGPSQQIRKQDDNTRRVSVHGKYSWMRQDEASRLEDYVTDESSDESSDDASDKSIDKSEDPTKLASRKDEPQSVRKNPKDNDLKQEDSIARPPIQEGSDVSISPGEDDGSDDDSADISQNTFHKPDETPKLIDGDLQDKDEEDDPTHVNLFSSDEDGDGDDSEHRTREFTPSQQLQQEQEMNVNTDEVTEITVATSKKQRKNMNSENAAQDTVLPDCETGTTVDGRKLTGDTVLLDDNIPEKTNSEAVAEDAAQEADNSPSEKESASETSPVASGLFRYTPDGTEDAPSPTPSHQRKARSRNAPRQVPVVEIPRRQRTLSDSLGSQNRVNRPDQRATLEEEERSWLAEAKLLGGQAGNWEVLFSETLAASELVDPSKLHYFQDIETLIGSLQKEHATVLDVLEKKRQPSSKTQRECERLRRCLDDEGERLRDMIYYRSVRDEKHRRLSGKLAEEFEARVFHPMVIAILQCFKAYRYSVMHQLFRCAYDHLHETMKLLHKFSRRSNAQANRGQPPFRSRGGRLIKALDPLIEALERDALSGSVSVVALGPATKRRQRQRHTPQLVSHTESPRSPELTSRARVRSRSPGSVPSFDQRAWTEVEGCALLKGLRRWQGPRRYHHILEHYPDQLGGRTVRELRANAQLVRDAWFPHIEETARTQEQRQRWQWLLEV